MDGTPTLRMNEFILGSLAAKKVDLGHPRTPETGKGLPAPTELKFVVNETIHKTVKDAEIAFDNLIGQHDMHVRTLLYPTSRFSRSTSGPALRRLWKGLHQEVQGVSRRLGSTRETARLPQDVWETRRLLRERANQEVSVRKDGSYQECQQREQGMGRGDDEPP